MANTITYANKVALNENPDIADINKVKADDMNEIKSVVNNNAGETNTNATNITNLQTYSTSEVNTGKIWTDGKPIYRKVVTGTLPGFTPSSGGTDDGNVAHGISNFNEFISISGKILYSNTWYAFPVLGSNQKMTAIRTVNSTNIVLRAADSWAAGPPVQFIIEYTKTTN